MPQDHDSKAFMPGPLDELVPGLRKKAERLPALPVHPRILEARREDGSHAIVMASFAAATNVRTYHAALKPLIEAALLTELSRPAEELAERASELRALELYMFAEMPFDLAPALGTFGLRRVGLDDTEARRTLGLLRREAQLVEGTPGEEPRARYSVPVVSSPLPLCEPLHRALLAHAPAGGFGTKPGVLARGLCDWLATQGFAGVEPTPAGIERLESLVVHRTPGVIRWIEPLVFQALCDLIAVAALGTWGVDVEWGVCEPDPDTKLSPPPLLRVQRDDETFHVPLGEHVLRWCVMPAAPGESIPSLGAWAEHEFQ